ncbi:hypothetical protein P7M41_24390 [Vibrio parahaemolyticus]|uniref:hypothetical protein n=1 Tax=Vibrio parahaemolyticus TaxID=670 RepID=UPI00112203CE|nr:hypothetical protein [Vibrio parahaemolyticus]MDF4259519.1 hypothetical protein [Vibrio parahaemolyticus]MDF4264659.1 hypothetical protein [Vibrio parahaemolyticus]MDF4326597.1 hypothetical protein [Vibrio parahaemolyticus]MDG2555167.1 hypothetical protein [Vibrio parahaemolyticus]TOK40971.1 hypothetical protein CGI18_23850 [Vibrio parahaemolyticus]
MTSEIAPTPFIWSELIPLISTLLGAGIAFCASYFNAKLTKARESKVALETRERERIERIYRLLVQINNELLSDMSQCMNHIHYQQKFGEKVVPELPPAIELEMLVDLYFPELVGSHKKLLSAVHLFTKKMLDFRFQDYSSAAKNKKQHDCGELLVLSAKVEDCVKSFQAKLKELVKV